MEVIIVPPYQRPFHKHVSRVNFRRNLGQPFRIRPGFTRFFVRFFFLTSYWSRLSGSSTDYEELQVYVHAYYVLPTVLSFWRKCIKVNKGCGTSDEPPSTNGWYVTIWEGKESFYIKEDCFSQCLYLLFGKKEEGESKYHALCPNLKNIKYHLVISSTFMINFIGRSWFYHDYILPLSAEFFLRSNNIEGLWPLFIFNS